LAQEVLTDAGPDTVKDVEETCQSSKQRAARTLYIKLVTDNALRAAHNFKDRRP
jgi:hypothetical protein